MRTRSSVTSKDEIHWYYEQEGSGPHVVLVPDGLGECQMFDKAMTLIADNGFTVTTFDMPGMSRSANAPPETYEEITSQKLARYVIGICDKLCIDVATFWGSSSGGCTVLALAANYPERVRNALPHEVPTYLMENLKPLLDADDDTVSRSMSEDIPARSVGNEAAWYALGDETHKRLWKNYPRWARGYPRTLPQSSLVGEADLAKRPLCWTVGASTPTFLFLDNIITATRAGIPFEVLPGMHFPYVSHPEAFAEHVVEKARKHL